MSRDQCNKARDQLNNPKFGDAGPSVKSTLLDCTMSSFRLIRSCAQIYLVLAGFAFGYFMVFRARTAFRFSVAHTLRLVRLDPNQQGSNRVEARGLI